MSRLPFAEREAPRSLKFLVIAMVCVVAIGIIFTSVLAVYYFATDRPAKELFVNDVPPR